MSTKVALISLGCSKNLVDSEVMLKIIGDSDYTLVNDINDADIAIINTCGFIESAKQESIDTIISAGELKKAGKLTGIIAAGCLAERYNSQLLELLPELDGVIGVGDYKNINGVLEKLNSGEKILEFGHQEEIDINQLPRVISTGAFSAYIKIAEGCDNRCTYCAIPSIRGKYRSRRFEDIIAEAKTLAAVGIKELNVIAQDTTRYGIDLYGELKISELLVELEKIEGFQWIRLLYSYPDSFSDELIQVIKNSKHICHYLDIPIQHANNRILKKMGRRTNQNELVSLIEKLRKEIPDIIIRTSIIVGFPGEEEESFEDLYYFVKKMKLDRMGVFTYSREEGTPAYRMKNQLNESIKQNRQDQLMMLQQEICSATNNERIGKIFDVLIEKVEFVKDNNSLSEAFFKYEGRTYMDAPEIDGLITFFDKEKIEVGTFIKIKVTSATEYDLIGERI